MFSDNPKATQMVIIDKVGRAINGSEITSFSTAPMAGISQTTEAAIHEVSAHERYAIERLTAEMRYQFQIIVEKGDVTNEQKKQILLLASACMVELREVSVQLSEQVQQILKR